MSKEKTHTPDDRSIRGSKHFLEGLIAEEERERKDEAEAARYREEDWRTVREVAAKPWAISLLGVCLVGYLFGQMSNKPKPFPKSPEAIIELTNTQEFNAALEKMTPEQQDMVREALTSLCEVRKESFSPQR